MLTTCCQVFSTHHMYHVYEADQQATKCSRLTACMRTIFLRLQHIVFDLRGVPVYLSLIHWNIPNNRLSVHERGPFVADSPFRADGWLAVARPE